MAEISYQSDQLVIDVAVSFAPGAPVADLTGAAVAAIAKRKGRPAVAGVGTVEPGDTARAVFAPGSLSVGVWEIQIRATKGGQVRTVLDEAFTIRESY